MAQSHQLEELIAALRLMPGIGPRAASRIAFFLLDRRREDGIAMAETIRTALEKIRECRTCRNYSDNEECDICTDVRRRESGLICVVEQPSDVQALESSGSFRGRYFVLHGHLSPLDGVGPEELGLPALEKLMTGPEVAEIILATNPTVEGDATASYIAALARRHGLKVSKIASGVPLGGELDTVDEGTLQASLQYRRPF